MKRLARLWPVPLIALVPLLQREVDRRLGGFPPREILYLWSGDHVKALAPGFEDILADVYWIRTVQHFGSERLFSEARRFELLYPLVDIATTLDPGFVIAYKYGAIFLCEPQPVGKGDPVAGIRLLRKGVAANPRNWRLRQDLGYFRYMYLKDAKGGAEELLEATRIEGAPKWLVNLADQFLTKGEDRQTTREIWQRLYQTAEEEFLRQSAVENLLRLDALDTIDALNARVDEFARRRGRFPRNVDELTADGVDPRHLVDPTGVVFAYDPGEAMFWFSPRSRLWQLLGKPKRTADQNPLGQRSREE